MGGAQRQVSVDFCVEGATYHTYVRFCCQSQVQITYIACVRCILGAVRSHMVISQKGMRISINVCNRTRKSGQHKLEAHIHRFFLYTQSSEVDLST